MTAMEKDEQFNAHLNDHFLDNTEFWEKVGEKIELPKNYILYQIDDVPEYTYYIKSGMIVSFEYTSNGDENIFNIVKAGTLMFDASIFIRQKFTVNFKTLVPSVLYRIERQKIIDIVENDNKAALDVIKSISKKFLNANEQMRENINHNAYWKTINLLISFASQYGIDYDNKTLIQFKLSQQLMANILRINRVTVANVISDLKEKQLIEIINGHYCIRDMEKLYLYSLKMDKVAI